MSANGKLKDSELTNIAGGGKLRHDAADAWNAFDRFLREKHGTSLQVTDSYRPLGKRGDYRRGVWSQWAAWERYQAGGNLAAKPGTSNHGWGLAVDVPYGTQLLIKNYGEAFGWAKKWSDAPGEPWHFKWREGDYSAVDKYSVEPTLKQGDKNGYNIKLKKLLKKHGYWPNIYPVNNTGFGALTTRQVKKFQSDYKLVADGIVGPGTWKALNGPVKSKPTPPKPAPKPPVKPTPKPPAPKPPVKPIAPKPKPPTKPKNPNAKYFADISNNNAVVNIPQYKLGGYPLIVLKATEGKTYKDATFPARFREAGKVGLTRFVYHFARPGNGNSPEDEAKNFCSHIKAAGKLNPDDRLVLDWEDPKFEGKNGDKWIAAFIKEVGRQGYTVRVLYSYGPYLSSSVKIWPKDHKGKPLRYWHAAYNKNPEANIPAVAKGKGVLWAVQYTDGKAGSIEPKEARGIGPCDMNYLI